jgi:putative ribosome biogenesis GTPase RsgA
LPNLRGWQVAEVRTIQISVKAWLSETNYGVDCVEKKEALTQMFENSRVALMYGSAGTGKSTLVNVLGI